MDSKIQAIVKKCSSISKNISGIGYGYTVNSKNTFDVLPHKMVDFMDEYCRLAWDDTMKEEKEENVDYSRIGLPLGESSENVSSMPFIVDMSLVFSNTETDFFYDKKLLYTITNILQEIIQIKLQISNDNSELLCCVLESEPFIKFNKTYKKLKFHFPYCVVDKEFQKTVLIPELIKQLQNENVFKLMEILPIGDWSSIICSIPNLVPLYRSKDSNNFNVCQLSNIFSIIEKDDIVADEINEMELIDAFSPKNHSFISRNILKESMLALDVEIEYWLPLFLSIHFCNTISNPKIMEKKSRYAKSDSSKGFEEEKSSQEEFSGYEDDEDEPSDKDPKTLANVFLPMLKKIRFERTDYWIIIGKTLFNIYDGSDEGLEIWIQYSEDTNMSERSRIKCETKYYSFRESNFTIITLARFARDDSKSRYNEWHNDWCQSPLEEALSCVHNDVTEAIYRLFWLDIIFTGNPKNPWYVYSKNTWKSTKKAMELRKLINDIMIPIFKKMRFEATNTSLNSKKRNINEKNIESLISQVTQIIKKLGTCGYKSALITMSEENFFNSVFETEKDKNHFCTGWKNGVIECCGEKAFFREGISEDYITMSTRLMFKKDFSWEHPLVIELMNWLKKVFCDHELLHHFLKDSAKHLVGKNSEKRFRVWTGGTNGSKSMIMKLYKATFGQYCCDMPLSAITKTLPGGSGPTPELSQLEGSHLAFFSEPDDDDELQPGKIKKGTGGDSFFARSCNEDGGSIENFASYILLTNEIPYMPNIDTAIKERFSFLPFLSTFTMHPPEDEQEQIEKRTFKMDPFFDDRIPELALAFAWVLVEYYPKYKKEGLEHPKIIVDYANNYWKSVDPYSNFISEKLEYVYKDKECKIFDLNAKKSATDMYPAFNKWFRSNNPGVAVPSAIKFSKQMLHPSRLGKAGKDNKWSGITIKAYDDGQKKEQQ